MVVLPPEEQGTEDSEESLEPELVEEEYLEEPPEAPPHQVSEDTLGKDENLPDLVRGAVSANDPLRQYIEEIKRFPLLTPEEEWNLAMRLREAGDPNAARRLVQANLRLVVKIAFEYKSISQNLLDLIQEGNIGLMKAVSKFDPSKGAKLSYYSSWWIRSYILKYLLDNFRLVRLGTTHAQKKLFYHLLREKERLESQGVLAAPKLLAARLDVSEKEVLEMGGRLSSHGTEVSLDQPLGSDQSGRPAVLGDFLQDTSETAEEVLEHAYELQRLQRVLPFLKASLTPKELEILTQRILSEAPETLQAYADRHQMTREGARQVESRVIEKLRQAYERAEAPEYLALLEAKPRHQEAPMLPLSDKKKENQRKRKANVRKKDR
jgi:RNA polymerase sigma-32 factor